MARRRITFSEEAAGRIARATLSVERGNRDMSPIKFRTGGGDGGGSIRIGKTAAAWDKGTIANISVWEAGTPPSETQNSPAVTLEGCVNKFADVATGKWVALAQAGNDRWYLIAAEC
jgi:hypothetical protein